MPPLSLTQAKYALAMFAMSVNDVPGWLVTIPPSGIGVPVALTPGLAPHCDVLTVVPADELVAAGLLPGDPLLLLLPLLHPAASIPMAAARATAARARGACSRILTYPHLQVVMALNVPLLRGEPMLAMPSPRG
jgi:hypothetical protein